MPEGSEDQQESGSQLRQKLEAALAENRSLREAVNQFATKGFQFVKPEDLAEVAIDQIEAKAAELEAQRKSEQDQLLAARLGVPVEELDAALAKLKGDGGQSQTQQQQAVRSPFASTGALGGEPVGSQPDPTLFGRRRIEAALAAKK